MEPRLSRGGHERLTAGHKLHLNVGAPAIGADEGQVTGSGPHAKRRLEQ